MLSHFMLYSLCLLQDTVQNENVGSLFKKYSEFQDNDSRAVNQEQGLSKCGDLYSCTGPVPIKWSLTTYS